MGETLVVRDVQLWLKRLRKLVQPKKIRYFIVGEYGEQTKRPHYHAVIYGLGREHKELMEKSWSKDGKPMGFIYVGDLTFESAQYVAGYVTKKLTQPDSEKNYSYRKKNGLLLGERSPEFARMSLRPGIGAKSMEDVFSGLVGYLPEGDVPSTLKHGKKEFPLGRYLRKKLRECYGFKKTGTPKEMLQEWSKEVSELYENYLEDPEYKKKSWKKYLFDKGTQKVRNLEARAKIYSKGGSI